ncbi:hypothetical protein DFH06DRAFT_1432583 [Mycena polygramma]|nr:hypothetical protein DFH06DRAFT_1432583 [Mycena polygramma]
MAREHSGSPSATPCRVTLCWTSPSFHSTNEDGAGSIDTCGETMWRDVRNRGMVREKTVCGPAGRVSSVLRTTILICALRRRLPRLEREREGTWTRGHACTLVKKDLGPLPLPFQADGLAAQRHKPRACASSACSSPMRSGVEGKQGASDDEARTQAGVGERSGTSGRFVRVAARAARAGNVAPPGGEEADGQGVTEDTKAQPASKTMDGAEQQEGAGALPPPPALTLGDVPERGIRGWGEEVGRAGWPSREKAEESAGREKDYPVCVGQQCARDRGGLCRGAQVADGSDMFSWRRVVQRQRDLRTPHPATLTSCARLRAVNDEGGGGCERDGLRPCEEDGGDDQTAEGSKHIRADAVFSATLAYAGAYTGLHRRQGWVYERGRRIARTAALVKSLAI